MSQPSILTVFIHAHSKRPAKKKPESMDSGFDLIKTL